MQIYIETVGFQHARVSAVLANLAKMFYEQVYVDHSRFLSVRPLPIFNIERKNFEKL